MPCLNRRRFVASQPWMYLVTVILCRSVKDARPFACDVQSMRLKSVSYIYFASMISLSVNEDEP